MMRAVLREAGWLARTSHLLGILLFLATAGATASVVLIQAGQAADAVDEERRALDRGRDVWIFRQDESGLDSRTCVQLTRWPGVLASGGLGSGTAVGDDREIGFVGRLPWILDHRIAPWADVALGAGVDQPTVAARPARSFGAPVRLRDHERTSAFTRAVLIRQPDLPTVQECWVEFGPDVAATLRPSVAAVLGGAKGSAESVQLARGRPRAEILEALTGARAGIAITILSAALAILVLIALGARRQELALYRDLGYSTLEVVVLAAVATWIVVIPGLSTGLVWAIALSDGRPAAAEVLGGPSAAAVLQLLRIVAIAVPGAAFIATATVSTVDRR